MMDFGGSNLVSKPAQAPHQGRINGPTTYHANMVITSAVGTTFKRAWKESVKLYNASPFPLAFHPIQLYHIFAPCHLIVFPPINLCKSIVATHIVPFQNDLFSTALLVHNTNCSTLDQQRALLRPQRPITSSH